MVEVIVEIAAHPDVVWGVMVDVEKWPEWTASMTRVELLEDRPFGKGSRARIKQPKLPAATWRVTDFEAGKSFTWESNSPGATMVAAHKVEPRDGGGSLVILAVEPRGLLGGIVGQVGRALIQRYVEMEAAGLKRRSESLAAAGAKR